MSKLNQEGFRLENHSVAGAIKDAMARRRMGLRELSDATGIPSRTLQNYLLGITSGIPVLAVAKIAEALDVSADWLILGREPNLDRETLLIVLKYFVDVIRAEISSEDLEAAADAFLKFYEHIYIHHYSLPGVAVRYQRSGKQPDAKAGRKPKKGR